MADSDSIANSTRLSLIAPLPVAARGLFLLAIIYTLYFASSLLIPIAFAIFLNIAFSPLVTRAKRLRIPKALAAALIVSSLVAITFAALLAFAEPAEEWLSSAPTSIRELQTQMLEAKGRLGDIQELATEVEELAKMGTANSTPQVVVQGPGVLDNLLGDLPIIFGGTGITLFLAFFLLAAGDDFLRRMTLLGRSWRERKMIVKIVRQIQKDLSRYLITVTFVNILLGMAVALVLLSLGVKNPLLWGSMVAVLNFAPYVGALMSAGVLVIVGLGEFNSVSEAMLVPGLFLMLTVLEGQLITPAILGRRMALSPVSIFIAVIAWGWMWGVAGALIAVPIVTSLKVMFDNIPRFRPLSVLLFGGAHLPVEKMPITDVVPIDSQVAVTQVADAQQPAVETES